MVNRSNRRMFISWALVLGWMLLIFYLSHQQATKSSELSSGIAALVISTIENIAFNIQIDIGSFHYLIRKSAHFFAYLILGFLVINAFKSNRKKFRRKPLLALSVCVIYAVSDEVHQLFIPGRSGEVGDVLIDSFGAIVGIGFYLLLTRKIEKSCKRYD